MIITGSLTISPILANYLSNELFAEVLDKSLQNAAKLSTLALNPYIKYFKEAA